MGGDLNEASLECALVELSALRLQAARNAFRIERCRLLPTEPTIEYIAYPAPRWEHHGSIWQPNGERFDIWINWDDRVRIECNGVVVLRMWAPAGEIFRAIEFRDKATKAAR